MKTFYFRSHFNFDGEQATAKLKLRHAVDDAAVFCLNGQEIHRFGIAAGVVVDATTDGAGHENAFEGPFDIPATALVKGDNVLAAEVHQSGGSSSDMVFGAELIGTFFPEGGSTPVVNPATLTVKKSGAQIQISWTEGGTLQETASLTAPIAWTPVQNASNPQSVTPSGGAKFYRVVR